MTHDGNTGPASSDKAITSVTPPKARWHPSYALAIVAIFVASVAAFVIGSEAGRFATFTLFYLFSVAASGTTTWFFARLSGTSQSGDWGWLLSVLMLLFAGVTIYVAVFLPFAGFEYVSTGIFK